MENAALTNQPLQTCALVERHRKHQPFQAALVAKGKIQADLLYEGRLVLAFHLHAGAQYLFSDLHTRRAYALASSAVEAMVHVVAEASGRVEQSLLHLAHQLHPAAR